MNFANQFQIKSIENFNRLIEEGNTEIYVTSNVKIRPKSSFVDKIPRIDIYRLYGFIDYSLERLNEILYAQERTSLEEIIEKFNKEWVEIKQ